MRNLPSEIKLAYMMLKVSCHLAGSFVKSYPLKNSVLFTVEKDSLVLAYLRKKINRDTSPDLCSFSPVSPQKLDFYTLKSVQKWLTIIDIEYIPEFYYFGFSRHPHFSPVNKDIKDVRSLIATMCNELE